MNKLLVCFILLFVAACVKAPAGRNKLVITSVNNNKVIDIVECDEYSLDIEGKQLCCYKSGKNIYTLAISREDSISLKWE